MVADGKPYVRHVSLSSDEGQKYNNHNFPSSIPYYIPVNYPLPKKVLAFQVSF